MNEIIFKEKKTWISLKYSTAEDAEGDAFAGCCWSVDWQKSMGLVHIGPVSFY